MHFRPALQPIIRGEAIDNKKLKKNWGKLQANYNLNACVCVCVLLSYVKPYLICERQVHYTNDGSTQIRIYTAFTWGLFVTIMGEKNV